MKSYLGLIIKSTIVIFLLLVIALIALRLGAAYESDVERKRELTELTTVIASIASQTWSFIRPFLQIIIILTIVDWILGKWGISSPARVATIEWNIQTIIALIVVSAFSIAALTGITESVGALKDLALVVVGFYFGTQRSSVQLETDKGKMSIVEEHENDVIVQTKGETGDKPDSA